MQTMSGFNFSAMAMISGTLAISRFSRVLTVFAQFPDVAVLDVPAVFAQVRGDAVRARRLANPRGLDRVGFAKSASAITRFAQRGDVVNIDAEFEHVINLPAMRLAQQNIFKRCISCQKRRRLANSITF